MKSWMSLVLGLGLCLLKMEAQSLVIDPEQWVEPYKQVTNTFTVRPATNLNFLPIDDAYLQGTTRFNDAYLKVQPGSRVSYLKFDVTGLANNVGAVTLRLQENGDVGSGTLRVYRGSHTNWTETTITTNSAPATNEQVGLFTSGSVVTGQVVNIPITSLVSSNGVYAFVLQMDTGGNDIWFGSKESERKPQLIVATKAITRTQINSHFKTTNQHDGVIFLSQDPGDTNGWRIDGVSPKPLTNYVVGSQSGTVHRLVLVAKPGQVPSLPRIKD